MAPKKAEGAAAAPKAKSSHPSYQDMITDAIINLKDRNGSSRQSLKKYVRANNQITVTDNMFDSLFNKALKAGVEKGVFQQPKGPSGGTKLAKKAPAKKEGGEKKAPAKKPAAKKEAKPAAKKEGGEKKAAPKKPAAPKKETAKKPAAKKETKPAGDKVKTGRVTKQPAAPKKPAAAKPAAAKKEAPKKKAAPKKAAEKA